jgi:sugar lactone lactonase YvrE
MLDTTDVKRALAVAAMLSIAASIPKVGLDPQDFPEAMRGEVAPIAVVFGRFPDDASVLYQVAALHARASHTRAALGALHAMVATGAGLHPRGRDGFSSLESEPEYERLIATIRRQNPPVLRARRAFEIAEGDLTPEGIAYSARTERLYLGSVKRKIVSVSLQGEVRPFAAPAAGGLATVVGVRVDDVRGELWAVSNAIGPVPPDAVIGLFRFRLADGVLVRSYPIEGGVPDLLNDLVVAPDGRVYATESNAGRVLRLDPATGALDPFASELPDPNGITITPDGKYLFVAGWHGIMRIDVASGAKALLGKPANVADGCLDGLYWAGPRTLVGIQNCVHATGRVLRLELSADLASIDRADVLESYNPLFDGITTAAVVRDQLYFVANTQFRKLGKPGETFRPLVVLDLPLR